MLPGDPKERPAAAFSGPVRGRCVVVRSAQCCLRKRYAADAPDLQVRPVVSSGASGCSAPAGQDPAAAQAATVPSFDAGSLTCYKLGPAQLDISQGSHIYGPVVASGLHSQYRPQQR